MISDNDRRDVARRLREAASYYESMERDVDFYPVESALGLKPAGETAYTPESVRSLADLIDPQTSEQTNHDESSLSASPIDRDALLALADEMEEFGNLTARHPGVRVLHDEDFSRELGYARRIREALGVEP